MDNLNVVAVTVTYNRINTLEKTILALSKQAKFLDKIIVVDNNSDSEHKNRLKEIEVENSMVEVLWMNNNLGGSGGFYRGMKFALEKYNPKWYWIMDDDAYPIDNCLENLLKYENKLDDIGFLAPTIYGIDNKEYQMYHHKMISKYKVNDIIAVEKFEDLNSVTEVEANAFVGPLFSREAIKAVGLPDEGLFIYGDDTEYTYRVSRKLKCYLIKEATINHQDPPYQGKVVAPEGWWKEYYMFRNRYLFLDEFSESFIKNLVGKAYLTIHLGKRILGTLIKGHYKGFRSPRLNILIRAIRDGIRKRNGKTIDPKEYIDFIKIIRNKN